MVFVVGSRGGRSRGMYMVALIPLWSLGMRGIWCVCLYFVRLCGGDHILGNGICMLLVMGGVQE